MPHQILLDKRNICDLELLLNGGFNPLKGFLNEDDYNSVLENLTLKDGSIWSIPINLAINQNDKDSIQISDVVELINDENLILANLKVESIYKIDIEKESKCVFGTYDTNHPFISIMEEMKNNGKVWYVGGSVERVNNFLPFDFLEYRKSPQEVKQMYKDKGWNKILGFQTRNPMHRSHYELTKYALEQVGEDAKLLLHPVVGVTQDCDIDYHLRTRCYVELIKKYGENKAELCLLPLCMRMAGPREALWHALIRQNYGCTHFVVGRDHAGPSFKKKNKEDFFGPYDAHELLEKFEDKLDIKIIKSVHIVYVEELGEYRRIDEVPPNMNILNISGTKQREMLRNGEKIPDWFTFPEIYNILKKSNDFLSKDKQGFCLYFVGLSGSGKSTIANALKSKLLEKGSYEITILDGDIIRRHLSQGLTFSREDRSTNVRRIGYVASEITRHNGIVFCANIAPFKEDREYNRQNIKNYIEVYVDTDISTCEDRDCKGFYKLARAGIIKGFTGVNDPFEIPENADIVIKNNGNEEETVLKAVNTLLKYLEENEYLKF